MRIFHLMKNLHKLHFINCSIEIKKIKITGKKLTYIGITVIRNILKTFCEIL